MKLPKEVFVHVEILANDESFLAASHDLETAAPDMGEKRVVGRYRLVEKLTLETTVKVGKK